MATSDLGRRGADLFSRVALRAASLGMIFHFVSLVEVFLSDHLVWASVHNAESLLAFISMTFFMLIYAIYKTTSPGVVVFPVVFFLTFVAATGQQPFVLTSPGIRAGWLVALRLRSAREGEARAHRRERGAR